MEKSDEQLMLEVKAGSRASFDELLRRYQKPLINFLYRFVGDYEAARDLFLFQETFLRIYRYAPKYQQLANFSTFAYRIATNLAINELKKRNVRKHVSMDAPLKPGDEDGEFNLRSTIPSKEGGPLDELERNEKVGVMREALQSLNEDQRAVLIYSEYQGMGYKEIADIMGCSVGTVKSRVFRAKRNMERFLEERGYELP
jgi:RNA polymerase sigma-70 factor (ECF subfamily)